MTKFTPSEYQLAVYNELEHGTGSIIINAVAGSGKSTTLEHGSARIPAGKTAIFMAFNKSIAEELGARLKNSGVCASTFHSVGFGALIRNSRGKLNPDGKKNAKIVDSYWKRCHRDGCPATPYWDRSQFAWMCPNHGRVEIDAKRREFFSNRSRSTCQLVSLIKNAAIRNPNVWDVESLADHHNIDDFDAEFVIEVFRRSDEHPTPDFDDMLYRPVTRNMSLAKYDVVMIDEAQDTNGLQIEMVRRMLKRGGRVVAVGDRRQAIYGFRGAEATAMDNIAEAFNATELPLSICYRCSKEVVRFAQEIAPEIEYAENAVEGSVTVTDTFDAREVNGGDAILCRNVAPMIGLAYRLIGHGKRVVVLGRAIGEALVDLVNRMQAKTIDRLETKLDKFLQDAEHRAKSEDDEAIYEWAADQVSAIRAVIENLGANDRTLPKLKKAITDLFDDDSNHGRVVLSTIHKSKGLEWDNVFLYRPSLLPSKAAKQDWQLVQEDNLLYVAYTRAAVNLVLTEEIE